MSRNDNMDIDKSTEISLTKSESSNKRDRDEDEDEELNTNKKVKYVRKCKYCNDIYHRYRNKQNRNMFPECYRKWVNDKSLFKTVSELYHNIYDYLIDNDCLPDFITKLNCKFYLSNIQIIDGRKAIKSKDCLRKLMSIDGVTKGCTTESKAFLGRST